MPAKPIPAGDPAPFATSAAKTQAWPVLTSNSQARIVSYEDVSGNIIGAPGRRFLASRTSGGVARNHVGIDLFARNGDPVVACEDGTILAFYGFLESHNEMTYALMVAHAGFVVNYGEIREDSLSQLGLDIGSSVKAGQQIGWVGATGMLHFETYVTGTIHNVRWMTGQPRPKAVLNPTAYLLTLAERDKNAPLMDDLTLESLPPGPPAPGVKPQVVDTLQEAYYSEEAPHNRVRDVPLYHLSDRNGLFHKGSMQIDVDGSPRAYAPGNKPPKSGDPEPLDSLGSADSQGGSSTYVQGRKYGSITARGPRPGYFVSATSLRYDKKVMWDCDNFVDAEVVPYFVHPEGRNGVSLGTVGVIVHIPTLAWTPAIHADTNNKVRVSEVSLAVAVNLKLSTIDPGTGKVSGRSARNGDDDRNYFYIYFPGVVVSAETTAPHWRVEKIVAAATTAFEAWGGLDAVKACLKKMS